jgi:hypothetical protein
MEKINKVEYRIAQNVKQNTFTPEVSLDGIGFDTLVRWNNFIVAVNADMILESSSNKQLKEFMSNCFLDNRKDALDIIIEFDKQTKKYTLEAETIIYEKVTI